MIEMKKVLSFVLVLSLVLSSFSMAFAGTASDVAGKDCEVAVGALTELGVVSGYTDGTYKPEKAVNRAEAATLVVKALGLGEYAGGNTSSFTDLAGYEWAEGYIGYAEALGILNGDGNGKFRPGDEVTYQEMAKMLVAAVGYTPESLPGTWPSNYIVKAKSLGILDDITKVGNMAANRGDVAIMLFNTLDCQLGYIDLENVWQPNRPTETMMSRLDQTLFDPDGAATTYVAGDAFVLDENAPVADDVNVKAHYGAVVIAYANVDNEITGIKEVKTTFLTGEFENATTFVTEDKEYTVNRLHAGNNLVYFFNNGESATTSTGTAVATTPDTEYTIAVDVSGKTIKNVYSQATWTGVDMKATSTTVKNIADKAMLVNAAKFVLDDNEEIDTTAFVLAGVDSLDKIAKDDILTYYVNASNKITKLEVTNDVVTGKVAKMSSDSKVITVDGKEYKTAAGGTFTSVANPGNEVKLVLNFAGKVFAYEKVSGELDNYAIVIAIEEGNDATFGSTAVESQVKLYTAEGKEVIYKFDAEAMVENGYFATAAGVGCTTYGATATLAGVQAGSVVAYELNKDGEVVEMEIAATSTLSNANVSEKGIVAGYTLTNDTIVIIADSVTTATAVAGKDYKVAKKDTLLDATVTAGLYVADTETDEVTLIVVAANSTTNNKIYGVVNDAYTDTSDNGYGATVIIGNADAKEVEADAMASTVTSSALIEIKYNTDGSLDVSGSTAAGSFGTETTSGNAITVENNRLKAVTSTGALSTNYGVLSENLVVYVYDFDNSVWTVGDESDLDATLQTGDEVTIYKLDTDNVNEVTHVLVYIQ